MDRDDFMYYRQVTFGKRVKKFGPQEANSRPIVVRYLTVFYASKRALVCIVHCILDGKQAINFMHVYRLFHSPDPISLCHYHHFLLFISSLLQYCRVKIVSFQQKIVERFHRNKSKEANEDVAERVFLVSDERINLTFHLEDNRVTASTREFIRPPHTTEKGGTLTMTPDMTTTFQVGWIPVLSRTVSQARADKLVNNT